MLAIFLLITGLVVRQEVDSDSLGMEVIEGKRFIIHKVDPEQTLYRISKRYNVSVTEILKYNQEVKSGLISVGQIVKIPYTPIPQPVSGGNYHIVGSKETLYSISRKYQLSVARLKEMNNLHTNTLSIGQKIIVLDKPSLVKDSPFGEPPIEKKDFSEIVDSLETVHVVKEKETLFTISQRYDVPIRKLIAWNKLQNSNVNVGQPIHLYHHTQKEEIHNKKNQIKPRQNAVIEISENVIGASEVKEIGYAARIRGSTANRKYLALHNQTRKGTILKIRNPSNQREIFVRVVNSLETPAGEDSPIVQLSRSAFERLGGRKTKLKVEIIYHK